MEMQLSNRLIYLQKSIKIYSYKNTRNFGPFGFYYNTFVFTYFYIYSPIYSPYGYNKLRKKHVIWYIRSGTKMLALGTLKKK